MSHATTQEVGIADKQTDIACAETAKPKRVKKEKPDDGQASLF